MTDTPPPTLDLAFLQLCNDDEGMSCEQGQQLIDALRASREEIARLREAVRTVALAARKIPRPWMDKLSGKPSLTYEEWAAACDVIDRAAKALEG